MANDVEERIKLVETFRAELVRWQKTGMSEIRSWLNQNVHAVRQETIEARTFAILTVYPPPAVGGPIMRIDPFQHMFDPVYLMSMVPRITDMLDRTIGVLRNPPPKKPDQPVAQMKSTFNKTTHSSRCRWTRKTINWLMSWKQ